MILPAKKSKAQRRVTTDWSRRAATCRQGAKVLLTRIRSCVKISESTADILEIIMIYGGILLTIALFSMPVVIHFVGPATEVKYLAIKLQ